MRLSPMAKGRGMVGEIMAGISPSASMSLSDFSDVLISIRRPDGGVNGTSSLRSAIQVISRCVHAVMLLQDAAHPDVAGRLEIGAADDLADQVLRRFDAGRRVDEDEAVAKAAVQKHRDGGERIAAIARS